MTAKGSGLYLNPGETNIPKIVQAVRQVMEGRSNAVGSFSIASNTTSTTVTAVTCAPTSVVLSSPVDSNAAADYGLIYFVASTGAFIAHHSSNGLSRSHLFAIVG